MKTPSSERWRKANKPVRIFFGLNPSLLVIYLLAIFGAKYALWTCLTASTLITVFFSVAEYKGVPPLMALRWFRNKLSQGKKRLCPSDVKL